MGYQEVPHAAVNALMQWVRTQGKQVVSLYTWPHPTRWSSLPDWSAHIEVRSTPPLHVRITRNGYKFSIGQEPDDAQCPACDAHRGTALVFDDAVGHAAEPAPVTQSI